MQTCAYFTATMRDARLLPQQLLQCSKSLSPELVIFLRGMRVYAQEQALRDAPPALGMLLGSREIPR
jgi:hypothetical protein